MAYLVLARKWRPQTWEEIVAQQHVTVTLRNAIQHNRLAHAYLFCGPRGVGKTSAARILAKALNCEKGPALIPCNACSSCIEITESRNIDVLEIDGASNRGIEDVRNLRDGVRYAPVSGKYKIYIIDEVHMLTNEAFNALLKTLEEPPQHVLFIFATTQPQKVPATIVSRCQRFDFHRASLKDIVSLLKRISASESIIIDEDALLLIAKKSDGSLRDSQTILDQIVSFATGPITVSEVNQALGMIDQELYFRASDCIAARDGSGLLGLVESVLMQGTSADEFLSGLVEHFRNLLVTSDAGGAAVLELPEADKKRYAEAVKQFRIEDILRLMRITTDSLNSLKLGIHPRFILEFAVVKMARMDKTVTVDDLLSSIAKLKQGAVAEPAQEEPLPVPLLAPENTIVAEPMDRKVREPEKTPENPSGSGTHHVVSLKEIQDRWEEFIQEVKLGRVTVGTFLQESAPVGLEGNTVVIGFRLCNGFHIDAILRAESIMNQALRKVYGRDLRFRCLKGEFAQLESTKALSKEDQLQKLKETNPTIDMLSKELGAELA
jgi:DNA polymerase-3 subunit gamma/tau